MTEQVILDILKDSPTLFVAVLIVRWLSVRIDRVLDLHERLIKRCYEDEQRPAAHHTDTPPF